MRFMSLDLFVFTTSDSKKRPNADRRLNFSFETKIQAEKAGTVIVISGPFTFCFWKLVLSK